MPDFLIAQQNTTTDVWTLFIGGQQSYSGETLDGVMEYVRNMSCHDLPLVITVSLSPLADLS